MSDIVDRLRADARRVENPHLYETQSLELYAADEIERLRSRLAEVEALLREARDREYLEWGCTAFVMRCDAHFENDV